MLQAGAKLPQLRVVADQRGTPTAAPELARVILDIADTLRRTGWRAEYRGIFHATGAGETTWHGFATAIFAAAAAQGYNPPALQAITTADWPTPARRPADSRLDCRKLARVFGITLPDWHENLGPIVQQLLSMDMPNWRSEPGFPPPSTVRRDFPPPMSAQPNRRRFSSHRDALYAAVDADPAGAPRGSSRRAPRAQQHATDQVEANGSLATFHGFTNADIGPAPVGTAPACPAPNLDRPQARLVSPERTFSHWLPDLFAR